MKILHISDFHYRNEKRYQNKQESIVDALTKEIKEEKIDFVIFSGDLVFNGTRKNDFFKAKELLFDSVLKKLNLNYENLFICSGNHDIDREQVSDSIIRYLDKDVNTNIDLNNFIEKKDYEISCNPILNYTDFIKDLYPLTKDHIEELFTSHIRVLNNKKIGILAINTAWRAIGNDDRGNLLFPIDKINEGLTNISEAEIKILIYHHPLSNFRDFNEYEVKDILHNNFDIIFRGHIHKNFNEINLTPNDGVIKISSSASLTEDKDAETGFSIINFNFDELEFSVTSKLFDSRNNIFYALPERTYEIPTTEEKKKQNKFRKTLRKRFIGELKSANDLFVSKANIEVGKSFLSICTQPVLKTKSWSELMGDTTIESDFDWVNLNKPEKDYLILGKDKCGKTTLLKKVQLDLLNNYSSCEIIPYYIDLNEWKNSKRKFDLKQEFHDYFEINKNQVDDILKQENVVLLLDNFHIKSEEIIDNIVIHLYDNPNIKLIACTDESVMHSIDVTKIDGRVLSKLYFHRLRKKHIKQLTKNVYDLPNEKQEEIVEKISSIFNRLSIPFNFWTVSLFLWIFKKDLNSNFQNDVGLINLYIEKLIEKERLVMTRASFGFDKYKRYLAYLAHHLLKNYRESTYSISFSHLVNFTEDYINKNPRYNISSRDIIEYIEERGIITKKGDDFYTFRLNGVFEYFIAFYMTFDTKFRDNALKSKELYLSFSNEFELYAGFDRDDEEFLKTIFNRTKQIFEPLYAKYKVDGYTLDKHLVAKLKEVGKLRSSIEKISKSLENGLSIDQQDAIEEQILKETGVDTEANSEVKKKTIQEIDDSVESLERTLFILGRVYKNTDEVNSVDLVFEIFDYLIESTCLWGFKIIEEVKDFDFLEVGPEMDNKEIEQLLKLISNFIPTLVQTRLYDMIGHRNLEKIILTKIDEFTKDSKDNQYAIFLLIFLLCDINLIKYKQKIDELIELITIPTIKYSVLLKLNYYMGFKTNEDKDLLKFLKYKIQKQQLSFNEKTDLGELHKTFSEKDKRRNIK